MTTPAPPTLPVLSAEQENAIAFVEAVFSVPSRLATVVAVAGPAGSGKTTLVRQLVERLKTKTCVTVTATTNKASYVLRKKGIDAVTFHQACMRPLFRPPLDRLGTFLDQALVQKDLEKIYIPDSLREQYAEEDLRNALKTMKETGVYSAMRLLGIKNVMHYVDTWYPAQQQDGILIIDEASMLGELELKNAQQVFNRIVLVGDEYQLPPVKSAPVFWNVQQRVALTEVHRQAADSQPLRIATALRNGERWQSLVEEIVPIQIELCRAGMPVIVWRNATRENLTKAIRFKLGYKGKPPQNGETLICRNSGDKQAKQRGFINNSLWTVESGGLPLFKDDVGTILGHDLVYSLRNDADEVVENESVHIEELDQGFGIPFRFGYSLTAHNAQGSEWDKVMVHVPDCRAYMGFKEKDARQWLYTAVTRAKDRVVWVFDKVG